MIVSPYVAHAMSEFLSFAVNPKFKGTPREFDGTEITSEVLNTEALESHGLLGQENFKLFCEQPIHSWHFEVNKASIYLFIVLRTGYQLLFLIEDDELYLAVCDYPPATSDFDNEVPRSRIEIGFTRTGELKSFKRKDKARSIHEALMHEMLLTVSKLFTSGKAYTHFLSQLDAHNVDSRLFGRHSRLPKTCKSLMSVI